MFAHRPQDGAHSPAAGLDPQLRPGGAEAALCAGGPGQDLPAALRHGRRGQIDTHGPTASVRNDRGWRVVSVATQRGPAEDRSRPGFEMFGALTPPVCSQYNKLICQKKKENHFTALKLIKTAQRELEFYEFSVWVCGATALLNVATHIHV